MMYSLLLVIAGLSPGVFSRVFSVNDDLLAFPQYKVRFSDFVLDTEAESSLSSSYSAPSKSAATSSSPNSEASAIAEISRNRNGDETVPAGHTYEHMMLGSSSYLCAIPVETPEQVDIPLSKEEESKELARANERGSELLEHFKTKCLYYSSGYWTYSFCYEDVIKQYHAIQKPGSSAPVEDDSVPSYILGQFREKSSKSVDPKSTNHPVTDIARAETRQGMRYMRLKLDHGTTCDITLKPRRVEVQFHCNPQSIDRIGLIKEVSTCSYLMIIYTPRLCDDVAFQPSKQSKAQEIVCKEILNASEIEKRRAAEQQSIDARPAGEQEEEKKPVSKPIIGGIELGGMKEVGSGKIQPPAIFIPDDVAGEIILKWNAAENDGKIQRLSEKDLRELDLSPDVIDSMAEELKAFAKQKPFSIRLVERAEGDRELRGMVDDDEDDLDAEQIPANIPADDPDAGDQGSKETYKDEL